MLFTCMKKTSRLYSCFKEESYKREICENHANYVEDIKTGDKNNKFLFNFSASGLLEY